jgi:hypothetical protein
MDFVITVAQVNLRTPRGSAEVMLRLASDYFDDRRDFLLESVRSKMRAGVSAQHGRPSERSEVTAVVLAGNGMARLIVRGTLPQTNVDERGRNPGGFPAWKINSPLYEWAEGIGILPAEMLTSQRRALAQILGKEGLRSELDKQQRENESTVFLIARAINERGLPRPGDELRRPFATTMAETQEEILRGLRDLKYEAAREINAATA